MVSKEEAKNKVRELVEFYINNRNSFEKTAEHNVRRKLIDKLFKILDWDVDGEKNPDEVIMEESIPFRESKKKKADYTFRLYGVPKFVVEAKAIKMDLYSDVFREQVVGYAYNLACSWAVLTNFIRIMIYFVDKGDDFIFYQIRDLTDLEKFEENFEILWFLSRKSIIEESLEKEADRRGLKRKGRVGKQLFEDLKEWRKKLSNEIRRNYGDKYDIHEREEIVQRIIDRLIFIRKIEDMGLEERNLVQLTTKFNEGNTYKLLEKIFEHYRNKYNSGLFGEPGKEQECDRIDIQDRVIENVISRMYRPAGRKIEYNFAAIGVDVLGNIYEQYLAFILKGAKLEGGRAHRKEQGIYYTPTYIVDYIVKNTVVQYNKNKTIDDILNTKILDPACGSGSFLIRAFDEICKIVEEKLKRGERSKKSINFKNYTNRLTLQQKITILLSCVYGVDLDIKAVEITQLNLLLKLLEGETGETIEKMKNTNKLLPILNENIKQGNSLIDDPEVAGEDKAFNWNEKFRDIMQSGGFDIVIGNPPYVRVQNLKHEEIDWYKKFKITAYKRVDISILFIELAKRILKKDGLMGYITSNQFLVTEYGRKMRQFILDNYRIIQIVDFGSLPIFEDAITYVSIFIFRNDKKTNFVYLKINDITQVAKTDIKTGVEININKLSNAPWILTSQTKLKLIDKLHSLPTLNSIGSAWTGIITGLDEILMFDEERIKKERFERDLILPIIRGTDPKRYTYSKPSKYVIYPYKESNGKTIILDEAELQRKYPICYSYLLKNKLSLLKRKDSRKRFGERKNWFGLVRFGQKEIFNKIKIVTPGEVKDHKFSLDISKSGFSCARVFAITIENPEYDIKYVLAVLNSKIIRFYLQQSAPLKQGGFYTYSSTILKQTPIKLIPKVQQKAIIEKVAALLSLNRRVNELGDKKTDERARIEEKIKKLENEIDELVYKIYGINEKEMKIIEESLR